MTTESKDVEIADLKAKLSIAVEALEFIAGFKITTCQPTAEGLIHVSKMALSKLKEDKA